jgi:hypothetical protein
MSAELERVLAMIEADMRLLRGENEQQRERIASLMLEEPSKSAGLYAAIDELQAEVERLHAALGKAKPQRDNFGNPVVSGDWVTVFFRPEDWAELAPASDENGETA